MMSISTDEPGTFFIWFEEKQKYSQEGFVMARLNFGSIDPGPYFSRNAAVRAAESAPNEGSYRIFKCAEIHKVEIGPPTVLSSEPKGQYAAAEQLREAYASH